MTLPEELPTGRVQGSFRNPLGNIPSGHVVFTAAKRLAVDDFNTVIIGTPLQVALSPTGTIDVYLPATDSELTSPTGFTYKVEEVFEGVTNTYYIDLGTDETLDLAAVAGSVANEGTIIREGGEGYDDSIPNNTLAIIDPSIMEASFVATLESFGFPPEAAQAAWDTGVGVALETIITEEPSDVKKAIHSLSSVLLLLAAGNSATGAQVSGLQGGLTTLSGAITALETAMGEPIPWENITGKPTIPTISPRSHPVATLGVSGPGYDGLVAGDSYLEPDPAGQIISDGLQYDGLPVWRTSKTTLQDRDFESAIGVCRFTDQGALTAEDMPGYGDMGFDEGDWALWLEPYANNGTFEVFEDMHGVTGRFFVRTVQWNHSNYHDAALLSNQLFTNGVDDTTWQLYGNGMASDSRPVQQSGSLLGKTPPITRLGAKLDKIGPRVYVRDYFYFPEDSTYPYFTLPEDYRPATVQYIPGNIQSGSDLYPASLEVYQSGDVSLFCPGHPDYPNITENGPVTGHFSGASWLVG